jgi:hypothetical protein
LWWLSQIIAADRFAKCRDKNQNPQKQKSMKKQLFETSAFLKAFLFLFIGLTIIACDSDDDDDSDDTPPAPQEVSFQVDLIKMVALEIKDAEGDALEIYGSVNSKLKRDNVTEENMVWSENSANYIAVGQSDYPLPSTVVYDVLETNVESTDLEVIVNLTELDFSNDDDPLGSDLISTPLSSITNSSTFQITLNQSSGQHIQVTYSITRL